MSLSQIRLSTARSSGSAFISASISSFLSSFLAPLNKAYFFGSRFTSGEIPFVNLTSDSYKFFPVSARRRRWTSSFLIRLSRPSEDVNIFGFPEHTLTTCFVKHTTTSRTRDATGVCIKRVRAWSCIRIPTSSWFKLGSGRPHAYLKKRPPLANLSKGLRISFRTGSSYDISFDSFLHQVDIER